MQVTNQDATASQPLPESPSQRTIVQNRNRSLFRTHLNEIIGVQSTASNVSSSWEQLQPFLDGITWWRRTFDPQNTQFPQIFRRFNDEYESEMGLNERKEEEQSPLNQPPAQTRAQQLKLKATTKAFVPLIPEEEIVVQPSSASNSSSSQLDRHSTHDSDDDVLVGMETKITPNHDPNDMKEDDAYDPLQDLNPEAMEEVKQDNQSSQRSEIQQVKERYASQNDRGGLNAMKTSKNKPVPYTVTRHRHSNSKAAAKRSRAARKLFIHPLLSDAFQTKCTEYCRCNKKQALYDYLRNTWLMQLNDEQVSHVNDCIVTEQGAVKFIMLDLHSFIGKVLYGVVALNDPEYRDSCLWKLCNIMTASEIIHEYNMRLDQLPVSSRRMPWFKMGIRTPPCNLFFDIIENTNFKNVAKKYNKQRYPNGTEPPPEDCLAFSSNAFKALCKESWDETWTIPIIMVSGKRQRVEWLRFIRVCDGQWVGISLTYFESNGKWKITCIHCDPVRVWYQHRLVGARYCDEWSYYDIARYVTTNVRIV
eukprot:549327_1